jgi:hypothetical protein
VVRARFEVLVTHTGSGTSPYVPAEQSVHDELPALENVPAGQLLLHVSDPVAPVAFENVPAGQGKHEASPVPFPKVPGGQGRHEELLEGE